MKQRKVILTSLLLTLSTMPLNVFANCESDVKSATFQTWSGSQIAPISSIIPYTKKVIEDTEALKIFKGKLQEYLRDDSSLTDWEYAKPFSSDGTKYISCGRFDATCTKGQTLKECDTNTYECMLNHKVKDEYTAYMINKICNPSETASEPANALVTQAHEVISVSEETTPMVAEQPIKAAPVTSSAPAASPAPTITVSGTVLDDAKEPLWYATISVIDANGNVLKKGNSAFATNTDANGYFSLTDVPTNAKLKIYSMSFKDEIITPSNQHVTIQLKNADKIMKQVTIIPTECTQNQLSALHATTAERTQGNCIPTDCVQNYVLKDNKCVPRDCTQKEKADLHADEAIFDTTTLRCVPLHCIETEGYTLTEDKTQCKKTKCSLKELQAIDDEHAKEGIWENGKCILVCEENFYLDAQNKCVPQDCTSEELEAIHATAGKKENGKCVPKTCANPNEKPTGDVCTKCTDEELSEITGATDGRWDATTKTCIPTKCDEKVYKLKDNICDKIDKRSDEEKEKALKDKQKAYDAAHDKEQSIANRTLTAVTTAATGIGGMQLAQGLSEQSADKDAAADMAAYIETMRCTYADGQQVTASTEEIELPGGNNQELMNLRAEYLALAADLKERKTALGMKPGIESEEILDKAQMGLYDDENVGITGGNYASLYRATALSSETDAQQLADQQKTSSNRVKGGAIAAGAGVVVGVVGNSLINGKLGELIKNKNAGKSLKAAAKIESDALEDLQKCLKEAGVQNTEDLKFEKFYPSVLSVKNIKCKTEIKQINKVDAKDTSATSIFEDSTDADTVYNKLVESFGPKIAGKLIGVTLTTPTQEQKAAAIDKLKKAFQNVEKRFTNAAKEDEKRQESSGTSLFDFSSLISQFGGADASSSIMELVNYGLK